MTAPATTRRVTPTAVRLLSADADRTDWLAARRDGVGSSDVAAILGVSDYATAMHVWLDKRGELDDTAGEAARWGTLIEDVVAREWARINRSVITRVGLVARHDQPWMRATLDRRVGECPLNREQREACALEIKCRSAFKADRWRADVPDDVLAQTAWQMAVTGYNHIHVAVLIGGNDYHQTVVRRDVDLEFYIVGEVARFRVDHLLTDTPPPWDMSKAAALNALDAMMHPDRVGEIDLNGFDAVEAYAAASAAKSQADRELKAARAELARLADSRRYVKFADRMAYEFGPVNRSTCDLTALAERWPDAYADTVTDKTHYSLRLAAEYRQSGDDT